jgi:Mrp family chromosome partitioning ATPase
MRPAAPTPGWASDPSALTYAFSPSLVALETPPRTRGAVAVQEMALQLVTHQVDQGRRAVAICGPSRGGGVSLLAANLAIGMAHLGVSVLLVDGDLHDPAIERLIAPSEPPIGLRHVLGPDETAPMMAIHHEVLPRLSILYAGGAGPDGSELVGGPRCADVITELVRDYDYTIIDTPPANRSPDARRLAGLAGYGLIVGRRNRTYADDISTLAGELAEDRALLVGTIYNDA